MFIRNWTEKKLLKIIDKWAKKHNLVEMTNVTRKGTYYVHIEKIGA